MSIIINNINGVIQIAQGDNLPKCYYGGGGTSGKFYPNKVNGGITTSNVLVSYQIISNTTLDCVDDLYNTQYQVTTSGSGSNSLFNVFVQGGTITAVLPGYSWGSGSGYAVGDTITFDGANYGGEGVCVIRVDMLGFDGFLIEIGGDNYKAAWYDLTISNVAPTTYTNAVNLLRSLFDGTTTMISL